MKSKNDIKLSGVLVCFAMLLFGCTVGLNIFSQLFAERPTNLINWIGIVASVLSLIIVPYVSKKEKEKENKN